MAEHNKSAPGSSGFARRRDVGPRAAGTPPLRDTWNAMLSALLEERSDRKVEIAQTTCDIAEAVGHRYDCVAEHIAHLFQIVGYEKAAPILALTVLNFSYADRNSGYPVKPKAPPAAWDIASQASLAAAKARAAARAPVAVAVAAEARVVLTPEEIQCMIDTAVAAKLAAGEKQAEEKRGE